MTRPAHLHHADCETARRWLYRFAAIARDHGANAEQVQHIRQVADRIATESAPRSPVAAAAADFAAPSENARRRADLSHTPLISRIAKQDDTP